MCKRQLSDKQTTVNYIAFGRSAVRPFGGRWLLYRITSVRCSIMSISVSLLFRQTASHTRTHSLSHTHRRARIHSGSPLSRSFCALSFIHLHPHRALAVGIAKVPAPTPLCACAWPSGAHPCAGASHCSALEESQQRAE